MKRHRKASLPLVVSAAARRLDSRAVAWVAVAAAVILTLPACFTGLHTEDWVMRRIVEVSDHAFPSKVNLFGHHGGQDAARRSLEYRIWGWFPWFTHPDFDVSFWRPLSSATHLLDYRLWAGSAWLMHLQNIAWYGALVAAVGLLYRKMLGFGALAGFAALLYAIDDAHGHAVGWISNRNGIMAAVFGVLSLYLFERQRADRWRLAGVLMPLCFAISLLAAEFGLSLVGYFVAYALFRDTGSWLRRALASLPWVTVVGLWALVYKTLGHSTHGSGLYLNPTSEPLAFAFQFVERATLLLAGQFAFPPSDLFTHAGEPFQGAVVFFAAIILWTIAHLFWPLLRARPELRFWAAGAVLSVAPACAAFPEDRLLFFVGIGAMPVIAAFILDALDRDRASPWTASRTARLSAGVALVVHGFVAPVLLPYRTLYMHRYERDLSKASAQLFKNIDPNRALILVTAPDTYFAGMMGIVRSAHGEPTVARMLTLAGTPHAVTLERISPSALRVRPEYGFMDETLNRIHRGRSYGFELGQTVDLLGVAITITDVDPSGQPLEAVFHFALPLEEARYQWRRWTGSDYVPFSPPALGETVVVEPKP